MSLTTRIKHLESAVPGDLFLYDDTGAAIFHWRSSARSACPTLDFYLWLQKRADHRDAKVIDVILRTRSASPDFGLLWQMLQAALPDREHWMSVSKSRTADSTSARQYLETTENAGGTRNGSN